MRDLEDEKRIREYMVAKMTHIKMYNECINLADGLDVAKFAELVRQDEREACAKVCDGIMQFYKTNTTLNTEQNLIGYMAAEVCGVRIRERGQK